jgi:hypothetical protein
MGMRQAVARQHGLDEAMADKVDHYDKSDLPEQQKVALRFTTAFLTVAGTISPELRAQLRSHFRPEQIVELVLDMSKWSTQKIHVCLGLDAPINPGGLVELHFDADGKGSIGALIPPA